MFGTLFRAVSPLVKRLVSSTGRLLKSKASKQLLSEAKKSAVKSGLALAHDTLSGENIGKSAQKNLKQFGQEVVGQAKKAIAHTSSAPPPRPRRSARARSASRRRRKRRPALRALPASKAMTPTMSTRSSDIFDADSS